MENENYNVEPKKKSPIGIIIVMVVLMIGCLVGGYFLNESGFFNKDKENTEEKEKKDKEEEKEEEVAIDSEEIKNLFAGITNAQAEYCGFYKLFSDKRMTGNDLTNEEKGKMVSRKLYVDTKVGEYFIWDGTVYSKEKVETTLKELLGSETTFTHETLKGCPTVDYDASTEQYKVGPSGCGGTCGPYATHGKVSKAIKKGNQLILTVNVVFGDYSKYYTDYAKTNELVVEKDQYDNPKEPDYSKGTTYKAVFKLENGHYALNYVEPAK